MPPPKELCERLLSETKGFITPTGFTGYPSELGILQLREKISEYYVRIGACVQYDEIFITHGAKPAIGEIIEVSNFTTALIITPTYPLYEELCAVNNIKVRFATLEQLKEISSEKFDVIFLCSPNNPTGEMLDISIIGQFIDIASKNNATIILDGAYADFSDNYFCPYLLKGSEKIIEVRTYSKNLCFTGIRCGYVVIKKQNPFNEGYRRYLSLRSNGVNVITQKTAIFSYHEAVESEVKKRAMEYRHKADIIAKVLKKHNIKFSGGQNVPYLLCECKESGEKIFKELLYKMGVVVTPGEAFRANKHLRISCFALEDEILMGAKLLDEYFSK